MPRFLNERATVFDRSLSQDARICGNASISVTSAPKSLSVDANSVPIAPPPIIATDLGTSVIESNSSDVRI